MSSTHKHPVKLRLWKSGAYAISAFDEKAGAGTLVEHDGNNSLHVVHLSTHTWEEIVVARRAAAGGVSITKSTLRGDRDGNLEWDWSLNRPLLHRKEHWKIPARGRGSWIRIDKRPGRTTTYHNLGDGRYRGTTTDPHGKPMWHSEWTRSESGDFRGTYSDSHGKVVGRVDLAGSDGSSGGGTLATWEGPMSSGSMESDGGSPSVVTATTTTSNGEKVNKWDEGSGHSVETGTAPGRSWIKITVPSRDSQGNNTGDTSTGSGSSDWVEFGSETGPGGSTTTYTINGRQNTDGSSSWERNGTGDNGDKEHVFGGTDSDGNSSYTSSVEHDDGSVQIVTRSVDKDGNGTEHTTDVDKDGNVTNDQTTDVGKGSGGSGSGSGSGGSTGGGGGDQPSGGGGGGGEPSGGTDPNDPGQPDQPDSPGSGGGGGGMPSDGDSEERTPRHPRGVLGGENSDVLSTLVNAAGNGQDEGDGQGTNPAERSARWRQRLGSSVQEGGDGTGGDEGSGGEESPGDPMISVQIAPPRGSDEGGWGDLNDPRAFVGFALQLAGMFSTAGKSGNLVGAIGM